ncbi:MULTISPECIES: type VI secretion system lipoprotein TssJ [Photorhabdus]|uniref:Type VI secretion system lipoprotein TssJ n=1 Tax=Photorhabdus stackebrandtii TaxID=1123042 RepID=A0A7X5TMQ9_9GAMM|nr:type VI secretion system lipoprotein TssJ [Photorhabdus stackebrandtii]NHB97789.1 type VI secretion system lipoprotein TssJ [Photorhabdus stackebrandtii]
MKRFGGNTSWFSNHTLWFVLLAALMLSGCSGAWQATKKVGQVVWDPSTPVGQPADLPSTAAITLLAEPDINPNKNGEPTPVEMHLIYLSEDSRLLAADYDQLESDKLDKALGKNYINHQDYTLLPGQYKPLPVIPLEKNSRYIGVIVRYADINQSEWKKVIKVKDTGQQYHILVHIRANEVELRKEEQ